MIRRLIYALAGVLAACAVSFGVSISSTPGGFSQIKIVTFCATSCTFTAGPYTPSPGATYIDVTCVGAGGGGGGVTGTAANNRQGGGGGGGAYSRAILPVSASSYAITLGAGGTGVSAADGNDGTATSVGSICAAAGGLGGGNVGTGTGLSGLGGAGATGSPGAYLFNSPGWVGSNGANTGALGIGIWAGMGASSMVGGSNIQTRTGAGFGAGTLGYSAGGGGGGQWQVVANAAGGNGGPGYVLIVEYIR